MYTDLPHVSGYGIPRFFYIHHQVYKKDFFYKLHTILEYFNPL